MRCLRKFGPISVDLVVACKIHDLQQEGRAGVEFGELVEGLNGIVAKSTTLAALNVLSSWGIVKTEYGETSSGRAGRSYSVSGEAESMIKRTYELFWGRVLEIAAEGRTAT